MRSRSNRAISKDAGVWTAPTPPPALPCLQAERWPERVFLNVNLPDERPISPYVDFLGNRHACGAAKGIRILEASQGRPRLPPGSLPPLPNPPTTPFTPPSPPPTSAPPPYPYHPPLPPPFKARSVNRTASLAFDLEWRPRGLYPDGGGKNKKIYTRSFPPLFKALNPMAPPSTKTLYETRLFPPL